MRYTDGSAEQEYLAIDWAVNYHVGREDHVTLIRLGVMLLKLELL